MRNCRKEEVFGTPESVAGFDPPILMQFEEGTFPLKTGWKWVPPSNTGKGFQGIQKTIMNTQGWDKPPTVVARVGFTKEQWDQWVDLSLMVNKMTNVPPEYKKCPACNTTLIPVDILKRRCLACHMYLLLKGETVDEIRILRQQAALYSFDLLPDKRVVAIYPDHSIRLVQDIF